MTARERREVAFHEAGHVALVYWRMESLAGRRIILHADRFGGSLVSPMCDQSEWDLMVLLGGPMAELLAFGIRPQRVIRFSNEYRDPNSDSSRIRRLVKALRGGTDDRIYQFAVQERVREIIEQPEMWRAIVRIAERLIADSEISGEEGESILEECGAAQFLGSPYAKPIQPLDGPVVPIPLRIW